MENATGPGRLRKFFSAEEIGERVRTLAADIGRDYAGRNPLLVAVLKGSCIFLADLVRALPIPVQVDFMAIGRYAGAKKGEGVRIVKDLETAVAGRDVLVVEDIVDTGLTLASLLRALQAREPASLAVCTLLDRQARRLVRLPIRYVGFDAPDRYFVGYGLDHEEWHRNLPYLAVLEGEGG